MATNTPNYNLSKPELTDDYRDFIDSYGDNMDIIDQNMGGGGGGGHTIVDPTGTDMPQENKLQFTGAVNVSDDAVNGQTVVDIEGGAVYGAFLNPNRMIYSAFTYDEEPHDWVAPEDCILTDNLIPPNQNKACFVQINGKQVQASYSAIDNPFVYVRKGQTVTYRAKSGSAMKAYGLIQGTNEIFAPVIYSDEEREIGVWRDGKPLYQRILTLTQNTALVADTWVKTEFNKDTMETLVRVDATIGASGAVVEALSGGFIDGKLALNSARNVGLNASDNARIIVQYTKTTDTAGSGSWTPSGASAIHYSTNEQVVGTWVDGKPLYQKTINITTPSVANTNVSVADITSLNIDTVVSLDGNYKDTNINWSLNIFFSSVRSSNCFVNGGKTAIMMLVNDNAAISKNAYVTIKYTKTTD